MDITYLGHSSFRIKFREAYLVTDPYNPKSVGIKYSKTSSEIVTISHDHEDHNFTDLITDTRKIVDGPGEYEILGISIIGIGVYHDDKKGELRGRNIIYIIEADGLRLVHLGDLGHRLSEDVIDQLGTVDVLMIPVGGFYTIGSSEATDIVRDIEPSITIPMHYKVEGINSEIFGKLDTVDSFLKEIAITIEKVEKLSIKANELGDEQKVVVFERK
ncbi:hypothetical protein A2159_03745 [Candidatus Woesebacteria bacterium RBG_13_34_9]|uniref:Lactamase n=1 Tax=Candidatus Woesebacteria bacterium RBG_13_34_9 TaxID=1802477 RepID=A0A1F7X0Y6_9BACT|nr:MAG: hypothetical protein A2159_03745 [Candidatus Woesebacteria bacterium RBG_13_34_9]